MMEDIMLKHSSSTYVNDYLTWFANGIVAKQVGEVLELTLPFLDRHRDQLQIYLQAQGEKYVLSDDGYTLADLRQSGVDMETQDNKISLTTLLERFGVTRSGNELRIETTAKEVSQAQHNLIQAVLALNGWGTSLYNKKLSQI